MQQFGRNQPVRFDRRTAVAVESDTVAMLGEIVAALAERVELLEAREGIGRSVLPTSRSRHRPQP